MASNTRNYEVTEFLDYMKPAKLDCQDKRPKDEPTDFVFWSKENDEHLCGVLVQGCPISERIKVALQRVRRNWWPWSLIQFWAPKRRGDKYFLSTCDEPFAIYKLNKKWSAYRKRCTGQKIYMWKEGENKMLGPVGRAFRRALPESSPNVQFYTVEEFPLRNQARRCLLSGLIVLPVYEAKQQICVGVLEFLGSPLNKYRLKDEMLFFEIQFKAVDLTLDRRYLCPDRKLLLDPLEEIKKAIKEVAETYPLALTFAFVPTIVCGNEENCSDSGLLKLIAYEKTLREAYLDEFIEAHEAFLLRKGEGVAGKALASLKSCFCRNICDFSITVYPFVHYARHAKLTLSFAICLQSTKLDSDQLILEFFLSASYDVNLNLLESLLAKFKQHLHRFKIVSGDKQFEELCAKGKESLDDYETEHLQLSQDSRHTSTLQILQNNVEMEQLDDTHQHGMLEGDAPNSGSHIVNTKEKDVANTQVENRATKSKLKRKEPEGAKPRAITLDELEKHYGKPQALAADHFGVSTSTLKRICRGYGIKRWPRHPKNQNSRYFFQMEMVNSRTNDGETSTSMFNMVQDARTVTIKASYGDLMIRFELRFDSKLAELEQEVAKRLNLEGGSFRMEYQDDENDSILITCDEDLRNCVETLTSSGKTTIRMSVHVKSN